MIRINQIKLRPGHTTEIPWDRLYDKAAQILRVKKQDISKLEIVKQSIDARKKPEIWYIYVVDVEIDKEDTILKKIKNPQVTKAVSSDYIFPTHGMEKLHYRPIIVGAGPAGLFCSYLLAEQGYRPILLERGKDADTRQQDVERLWQMGILDPTSNVQFGEGGAGTFSDGKLNTLVKDKDGRSRKVMETFVKCGAPEKIMYDSKPHIGTDILINVVKNMRKSIEQWGGEVRFQSEVTDILFKDESVEGVEINHREKLSCNVLVLAIGHSARDTFQMLYERKVPMEAKSFAVGLRVEHSQKFINESQYGVSEPAGLPVASYKVTAKTSLGRGVYSFCMCPGGYVVNASSEEGRLAVNGMSYSGRDSQNANSAIIVSVTPKDFSSDHPLAGLEFQRQLEEKAYALGQGRIPVQTYGEFREKVTGQPVFLEQSKDEVITPCIKGQYVYAEVSQILPKECNKAFVEGMEQFGGMIQGFNHPNALLSGVESRTSSPVRIHRDVKGESSWKGLYPCGEGAGYAGGITSAAMDGILTAERIASLFAP